MPYEFSNTWFDITAKASWDAILESGVKVHRALEIGSYEGASATYLLDRCLGLRIDCVDNWQGAEGETPEQAVEVKNRFDLNIRQALEANSTTNVEVHQKESYIALAKMISEDRQFDFIYIDGSHYAKDVLCDACMAWRMLVPHGIMVFDDYTWRSIDLRLQNSPKIAIDGFVNANIDQIEVINLPPSQFIVRKRSLV